VRPYRKGGSVSERGWHAALRGWCLAKIQVADVLLPICQMRNGVKRVLKTLAKGSGSKRGGGVGGGSRSSKKRYKIKKGSKQILDAPGLRNWHKHSRRAATLAQGKRLQKREGKGPPKRKRGVKRPREESHLQAIPLTISSLVWDRIRGVLLPMGQDKLIL